ncbi:hypothetical protein AMTRI_Chr08g167260 [Amborella trichopoda]
MRRRKLSDAAVLLQELGILTGLVSDLCKLLICASAIGIYFLWFKLRRIAQDGCVGALAFIFEGYPILSNFLFTSDPSLVLQAVMQAYMVLSDPGRFLDFF